MVSALISATVAFAVLIIAQCVIFWRERSRLLLGKLEDLYILLLDLGERNLTRFEPLTRLLASEVVKQNKLPFAQVVAAANARTELSLDEIIAGDLLERVSLLVDFYFPQLRPELDDMFETNRECIAILYGTTTEFADYKQVIKISTAFADRKAVMEKRILAERPVLTKTFVGQFRAWREWISAG
jgi:hypothetical protein